MEQERAFKRFRWRAIITSGVVTLGAAIAIVVVFHYQPSNDPVTGQPEKGNLSPEWFGVFQTLATSVFSIGAVSLLFEVLLKESYGKDLLRFLRLRVALVKSGLQDIEPSTNLDWKPVLESASSVVALVKDPSPWVHPNLPFLLAAARKRAASILIGLPDPDGPELASVAASLGLSGDELRQNIDIAVGTIENQWISNQHHIHTGARIRVVTYRETPMYEVITADEHTILQLGRSVGHAVGDYPLTFNMEHDSEEYPGAWLRQALSDLSSKNELWAREKT